MRECESGEVERGALIKGRAGEKAGPAFRCTTVHCVTSYATTCTADTRAQLHVRCTVHHEHECATAGVCHVSNPVACILDSNPGALDLLSYTLRYKPWRVRFTQLYPQVQTLARATYSLIPSVTGQQ